MLSSSDRAHASGRNSVSLRCDHCRGKLRFGGPCYWRMRFCSTACMSAYQQRLAPETQEKVVALDISRPFGRAAS